MNVCVFLLDSALANSVWDLSSGKELGFCSIEDGTQWMDTAQQQSHMGICTNNSVSKNSTFASILQVFG